jgi:hypothetical protein
VLAGADVGTGVGGWLGAVVGVEAGAGVKEGSGVAGGAVAGVGELAGATHAGRMRHSIMTLSHVFRLFVFINPLRLGGFA